MEWEAISAINSGVAGAPGRAGAAALNAWLDAQEKRRSADIALADNRLARLNSQLALYQALGGDAEPTPAP